MGNEASKGGKLTVERVAVGDLTQDPRNARVHPERNLSAIRRSMAEFGQYLPLVVNGENVVLAGNGRLAVARELGWTEIDVMRVSWLSPEQERALALADNRTSELAAWDPLVVESELMVLGPEWSAALDFDSMPLALGDLAPAVVDPLSTDGDPFRYDVKIVVLVSDSSARPDVTAAIEQAVKPWVDAGKCRVQK